MQINTRIFAYMNLSIPLIISLISILFGSLALNYFFNNVYNYVYKPQAPWKSSLSSDFIFNISNDKFQVGSGVSLDNDGKLQVGGGFSIYKNVFYEEEIQAKHLQVVALSEHLIISAYDAYVRIFKFDENSHVIYDEKFSIPFGSNPDQMHKLDNGIIILLSGGTVYPFYVNVFTNNTIGVTWGDFAIYGEVRTVQPVFDTLDDQCFAISCFWGRNIDLAAIVACTHDIDNENFGVEVMATEIYSDDRTFHAISGLSSSKFILAHAGTWPSTGGLDQIEFILATYENNNLTFSPTYTYKYHGSKGFFDFDNFNDKISVCTFVEENDSGGVASFIVKYNPSSDSIEFGPYKQFQMGGGSGISPSGLYQFLYMRILSDTRFGVFYSNGVAGGSTCFAMGEITPTYDIKQLGVEYRISEPNADIINDYYWSDITSVDNSRFVLNEAMTSNDIPRFAIHFGEVLSSPIGIISAINGNIATVIVEGSIKFPDNYPEFIVGKYYYINTRGDIVPGEFAGTADIDGIIKYINTDTQILSLNNRIGMATDKHTLYIQKNDLSAI